VMVSYNVQRTSYSDVCCTWLALLDSRLRLTRNQPDQLNRFAGNTQLLPGTLAQGPAGNGFVVLYSVGLYPR